MSVLNPLAGASTSSMSIYAAFFSSTNGTSPSSGSGGLYQQVLAAAGKYLGLSQQQLSNDLQSGQSLAQIAQSQGKKPSDLVYAIMTALQQGSGTSSQTASGTSGSGQSNLSQIVNRMVNGTGHHGGQNAAGASNAAGSSTEMLLVIEETQTYGSSASASGSSGGTTSNGGQLNLLA